MTSAEQSKKTMLGDVFSRTAQDYGDIGYFTYHGRRLVELARLPRGARVLDVATGRGAILFPAAEQVGLDGQVIGVDLADGMVEATNTEIAQRGLSNAVAMVMDAEQLDFPAESFDCVLCGFALQFLPHLAVALAEFKRVLKPGGRVVASTWGQDDPALSWYDELVAAYGAKLRLSSQAVDNPEELRRCFGDAGFDAIEIITEEVDTVYPGAAEWFLTRWSISGRAGLEKLEPAVLERFKAEVVENVEARKKAGGFHERLEAHFTFAAKGTAAGAGTAGTPPA